MNVLYLVIGALGAGLLVAIILLLTRRAGSGDVALGGKLELLERAQERSERMLREEMARGREEGATAAKTQREELTKSLEGVRSIVDLRLKQLQEDNSKQIDRMRATVDEKLQGTLEKRLGESFKLVSDRLEQVHQGLGAMQQLASDVGGLQRVLTNVKTRGGWSEWQLTSCWEEMLTPEQFAKNMRTRDDTDERVEFAIRLPGDENGAPGLVTGRREISDGTLRALDGGAGKWRFHSGGSGDENSGDPVEALRERYLREIH